MAGIMTCMNPILGFLFSSLSNPFVGGVGALVCREEIANTLMEEMAYLKAIKSGTEEYILLLETAPVKRTTEVETWLKNVDSLAQEVHVFIRTFVRQPGCFEGCSLHSLWGNFQSGRTATSLLKQIHMLKSQRSFSILVDQAELEVDLEVLTSSFSVVGSEDTLSTILVDQAKLEVVPPEVPTSSVSVVGTEDALSTILVDQAALEVVEVVPLEVPTSSVSVVGSEDALSIMKMKEKEEKLEGYTALDKQFIDIHRDADDTRSTMRKSYADPYERKEITSRVGEDGYRWRKYGQKDILGSKHPRSYFRCIHKIDQGCNAKRQVQQLEDDPPVYQITYIGKHTCQDAIKTLQPRNDPNLREPYPISFGSYSMNPGKAPPMSTPISSETQQCIQDTPTNLS